MKKYSIFMKEKLNIVKMLVVNLIYGINTISIKIPASYFVTVDKLMVKYIWKDQKTQSSQQSNEEEQSQKTHTI